MNEIEQLLIQINEYKKKQHFSCDIYFNDLDETFVCKVHSFGNELKSFKHFRNKHLVDSLLDAYEYIRNNF